MAGRAKQWKAETTGKGPERGSELKRTRRKQQAWGSRSSPDGGRSGGTTSPRGNSVLRWHFPTSFPRLVTSSVIWRACFAPLFATPAARRGFGIACALLSRSGFRALLLVFSATHNSKACATFGARARAVHGGAAADLDDFVDPADRGCRLRQSLGVSRMTAQGRERPHGKEARETAWTTTLQQEDCGCTAVRMRQRQKRRNGLEDDAPGVFRSALGSGPLAVRCRRPCSGRLKQR